MNLGLAAATFALVAPAELPDKTFISAIVLSSRYSPLPVWIGTAGGLLLQAAIGVLAGRLLALLPHRAVEGVVAALFLLGAGLLLFLPERREERAAELAGREEAGAVEAPGGEAGRAGGPEASGAPTRSFTRVAGTTFGIVALAEMGDLTQVVIANFTARSKDPLSVFVGAAAAFLLVSALGVAAGRTLTRYVPLTLVRRISGLALLGLGIWSLVDAL